MTGQEFGALLVFATAMSFSPGPNTTLSTALAANFGLKRALPFCLAVPVGWSLLMVLCGAGLGALLLAVPALRWGVKVIGVGYLLWLAWKLANTGVLGEADAKRLNVSFSQGMALQFVNIKAWMLALTIAAGWVAPAGDDVSATAERLAQVLAVMVVFAFVSNFSYALMGSLLRGWLEQGARLLWFNRVLALVLVATAAWMVTV